MSTPTNEELDTLTASVHAGIDKIKDEHAAMLKALRAIAHGDCTGSEARAKAQETIDAVTSRVGMNEMAGGVA